MAIPAHNLDALRADFPAWSIFRSDAGAYYGSRAVSLSDREVDAGFRQTVSADDLETFVSLIQAQDQLEVRS
ncbi:hypothetical protein ACGFJC_39870 [Nonomuraea fuscirosea]|uniref:hypothetical protein n=1 Tax=Nonomuraea fuscirosea TaxID=1291556 RepID=UPI003713FD13